MIANGDSARYIGQNRLSRPHMVPTQEAIKPAMRAMASPHSDCSIADVCMPFVTPLEKLWCKLKQDQLHLHPWAEDLPILRQRILDFF